MPGSTIRASSMAFCARLSSSSFSTSPWDFAGLFSPFSLIFSLTRTRMRRTIGGQQSSSVDGGIQLRGRKRGVAEEFLDGAQIAAAAQKMRGEGMAQRMRRGRVRQAERAAHAFDRELEDSG